MKHFLIAAITIGILDIPRDPAHVLVCIKAERQVCVKVERNELEKPEALEAIARFLEMRPSNSAE